MPDESKNGVGKRDDHCSGGMQDEKYFEQRERDLLILTTGMRDESRKSRVTDVTRRTATLTRWDPGQTF